MNAGAPIRTLCLLGTIVGLWPLSTSSALTAELLRGRCYMDTCTWFSVEEKNLMGTNIKGALLQVALRGWDSSHPNGSYERRTARRGGQARVVHAFCSKTMPALLVQAGAGRWQVDRLALNTPSGPPGALENATATYYAICHATAASDPEAFIRLGRHFGYPTDEEAPEMAPVAKPEDILAR